MKRNIMYISLVSIFLISALLSLTAGAVKLTADEIIGALVNKNGYESARIIIISLRLPRLLSAIVAGAGLALSGTVLQLIMGNDLASPNTVGVNAGAGLSVILSLSIAPAFSRILPLVGFAGAFLTLLLIMTVADRAGGTKASVILSGIACSTLFQAGISFFSILDTDVLSMYSAFSVGSFSGVEIGDLILPAVLICGAFIFSVILAPAMSAISLGERVAAGLGVKVKLIRTLCLIIAGVSAASVISFAGLLGFVGLVVPHITRKLVGGEVRRLIICAPLVGAVTVILSDLVGRCLFAPSEIPVGIVMALVGAPFFLVLLLKRRSFDA